MINQKKGAFTLIELLVVIIILGIIAVLVIPTIDKYLQNSYNRAAMVLERSVQEATELYMANNSSLYPELNNPDSEIFINLQVLVDKGYFKAPIKNPLTHENLTLTEQIKITVIQKGIIEVEFNLATP